MRNSLIVFLLALLSDTVMALTCVDLDGASVIANDGTYLGFFGSAAAPESIDNLSGIHGSASSSTSVRNTLARHGSPSGVGSAGNDAAINPPGIYKYGDLIAYLTTNISKPQGVPLAFIDTSCTFYNSAPKSVPPSHPPAALSGLIASDGIYSDSVLLTWNPAEEAAYYEIYVSNSLEGSKTFIAATTALSAVLGDGTPGKVYYYSVYPRNPLGTGAGQWDTGFVGTAQSPQIFSAITTNGSPTTAFFGLAASADGGATTSDSFSTGDTVVIAGSISPQIDDVNKPAYIYMVIRTVTAESDIWSYRDPSGIFRPWDQKIASLQPAYEVSDMKEVSAFRVYAGGALSSASHRIFIGYQVADGTILHYTPEPMRLEVSDRVQP